MPRPGKIRQNDAAAPLTGLVRPTLGDSTVLGLSSVKESRKLRAKSGIVTDTAACIGSMSALENLLMFASMYGMRKEQARTHAAQLLKKLDLWNARDRKVYTFSTEMCPSVIAGACACASPADCVFGRFARRRASGIGRNGAAYTFGLRKGNRRHGAALHRSS